MTFTEPRTALLRRPEPGPAATPAEIASGTGYEALLGLIMFAGHEPPGEYNVGDAWFGTVSAAASPALTQALATLCGGVPTVLGQLLTLVRRTEAPHDLASLIRLVRRLNPRELRLEFLGSWTATVQRGVPMETLVRAAEGEPGAVRDLLTAASDDDRWHRSLSAVLALAPDRTHELTLTVLTRWAAEVFADQEPALASTLAGAAARWQADAERLGRRAFIEYATGGILIEEDLPADRILVVPTVLGAPWVYATDSGGVQIFCCPVRDATPAAGTDLVRVLRALGDETRLTILRHLAAHGPASLAALTAALGISKSAVHKHLVLLRSAELVSLRLGNDRRYVLRPAPDLNALLSAAIAAGP